MKTKRILVINGSPRKIGNTELLADAFIRGAAAAGHHADKYNAAFHTLGDCRGCGACWTKGLPCVFSDDFNDTFAPLVEQANVLVLAAPLYHYSFPAYLKLPLDKMYAYASPRRPRKLYIRESALIVCGADEEMDAYTGVVSSYRKMANHSRWADRGVLVAAGLLEKGAVKESPYLQRAERLGRAI